MKESWFFEKPNQIGKPLTTLTKEKEKKDEDTISNIRNETLDITADPADIKRIQKIMLCTILHI